MPLSVLLFHSKVASFEIFFNFREYLEEDEWRRKGSKLRQTAKDCPLWTSRLKSVSGTRGRQCSGNAILDDSRYFLPEWIGWIFQYYSQISLLWPGFYRVHAPGGQDVSAWHCQQRGAGWIWEAETDPDDECVNRRRTNQKGSQTTGAPNLPFWRGTSRCILQSN